MAMESVVIVAIAVLAVVFSAAFVTVILLCRHKFCRKMDLISSHHSEMHPEVHLISSSAVNPANPATTAAEVELGEVTMNVPDLEYLLQDERWIDDATGLVPHCINILKTCHQLTERMVAMTMNNSRYIRTQETLTDIVTVVKKIGPRVDDVVSSMYPPLDPRLLEARCTALVLSVSHLVMVTKHICQLTGELDWIDQSLSDVDESLAYLREASVSHTTQTDAGDHTPGVANGHVPGNLNNGFGPFEESSAV